MIPRLGIQPYNVRTGSKRRTGLWNERNLRSLSRMETLGYVCKFVWARKLKIRNRSARLKFSCYRKILQRRENEKYSTTEVGIPRLEHPLNKAYTLGPPRPSVPHIPRSLRRNLIMAQYLGRKSSWLVWFSRIIAKMAGSVSSKLGFEWHPIRAFFLTIKFPPKTIVLIAYYQGNKETFLFRPSTRVELRCSPKELPLLPHKNRHITHQQSTIS